MQNNKFITYIVASSIFLTNCVSYKDRIIDTKSIKNGNTKSIGYIINAEPLSDRNIVNEVLKNTNSKYNYSFKYYDVNIGMDIKNDTERYYKLSNPESIYPQEETYIII